MTWYPFLGDASRIPFWFHVAVVGGDALGLALLLLLAAATVAAALLALGSLWVMSRAGSGPDSPGQPSNRDGFTFNLGSLGLLGYSALTLVLAAPTLGVALLCFASLALHGHVLLCTSLPLYEALAAHGIGR